jgi:hypothetical protein
MEYGKKDVIDCGIACKIKEDTGARLDKTICGFYEDADAEQLAIVFFEQ